VRFYRNPFRRCVGLTAGRIDMGVDYSVTKDSPVFSIGYGYVVRFDTHASWPGGHYIAIKLTRGRAKGKVFYLAEHLSFPDRMGIRSRVTPRTRIATLHPGFPNCEIGWAKDEIGFPPLAYGCYNEGDLTGAGLNFAHLLKATGAPMGLTEGRTLKCPLPFDWPTW